MFKRGLWQLAKKCVMIQTVLLSIFILGQFRASLLLCRERYRERLQKLPAGTLGVTVSCTGHDCHIFLNKKWGESCPYPFRWIQFSIVPSLQEISQLQFLKTKQCCASHSTRTTETGLQKLKRGLIQFRQKQSLKLTLCSAEALY